MCFFAFYSWRKRKLPVDCSPYLPRQQLCKKLLFVRRFCHVLSGARKEEEEEEEGAARRARRQSAAPPQQGALRLRRRRRRPVRQGSHKTVLNPLMPKRYCCTSNKLFVLGNKCCKELKLTLFNPSINLTI